MYCMKWFSCTSSTHLVQYIVVMILLTIVYAVIYISVTIL